MIGHQTKAELALRFLRERIRSGQLKPGQRLLVAELSRELGMSPTPVREALRLLQADLLVDYRAHRGIVVSEVSPKATEEVYRLRILLEPLAVELAVPELAVGDMRKLERLHNRFATSANSSASSMPERNREWHFAIYEASNWPILNDFIRHLWDAFAWRTMWALPGRSQLSLDQHVSIMEAIRLGDPERAADRMREHISSGQDGLLAHARRDGGASE